MTAELPRRRRQPGRRRRPAIHLHAPGPIAVEIGQNHQGNQTCERGIPPPHQDPYRAALRRNRADAPLGADDIGPDPNAQSGRLGNLGSPARPINIDLPA